MKKILSVLVIAFFLGAFALSQGFANMSGTATRSIETQETFPDSDSFLRAKGDVCEVATDGCNTVHINNGQLGAMTQMWCEDIYGEGGQEEWSCREYIKNTQSEDGVPTACTREYAPVCAQPPMPECPEGMACIQVMPPLQTYANACMARAAGSEVMYQGECRGDNDPRPNPDQEVLICPDVWQPVCGVDGITYGNLCSAGDTEIAYKGDCEGLVNLSRLNRLNRVYETRFTEAVAQVSVEKRMGALEVIEQRIDAVKRSRIATWVQEARVTELVFFRNIFQNAPYSE